MLELLTFWYESVYKKIIIIIIMCPNREFYLKRNTDVINKLLAPDYKLYPICSQGVLALRILSS